MGIVISTCALVTSSVRSGGEPDERGHAAGRVGASVGKETCAVCVDIDATTVHGGDAEPGQFVARQLIQICLPAPTCVGFERGGIIGGKLQELRVDFLADFER